MKQEVPQQPRRTSATVVAEIQKTTREMFFAAAELNTKARREHTAYLLGDSIRKIVHFSWKLIKLSNEFYYLAMNEETKLKCQVCGKPGSMVKYLGDAKIDGEGRGMPFHLALCEQDQAKFLVGQNPEVLAIVMEKFKRQTGRKS